MKKDIVWGYVSQFLQYGAALLILPLLLSKLSSAEMGIWYVLLTISTFAIMLDMGFTPTLARNVSYVMKGAKVLFHQGHDGIPDGGQVDFGLLRKVIQAARKIFFWLALAALVLMGGAGSYFVLRVSSGQVPFAEVAISWAIFVVATVINLYFKYYTPLLQGRGLFAEYYRITAISNLAFIFTAAVLLEAGWGLVAPSCGFLVAALVSRVLSRHYFFNAEFERQLQAAPDNPTPVREIILALWSNARRLGLVVVSAFFVLKANTLIASAALGLAQTARYALTIQAFTAVSGVAIVIVTIQQQKMAQHHLAGERQALKRQVEIGLATSLLLYVLGAAFLLLLGDFLISKVGGHTTFLPFWLMAWVALMQLLEQNHSVASSIITTRNVVPFVKPSLLSAASVFLGTLVGVYFLHLGAWWLVGAQFLTQLAYNNWKWPMELAREMNTGYLSLLYGGLVLVWRNLKMLTKRSAGLG